MQKQKALCVMPAGAARRGHTTPQSENAGNRPPAVAASSKDPVPTSAVKRKSETPAPGSEVGAKPAKRPSRPTPPAPVVSSAAAAKAAAARQTPQPRVPVQPPPAALVRSATFPSRPGVGDLEAQIDVANEELMTLTEANEGLQQRLEAEKLLYTKELDELRSALQAEKAAREAEASAHQETKQVLSEAQAESERRATELRAQKTELEARCAALTATESELRQNKAALEATVAARELDLETLAARGRAAEELRREMHETISELKGNIRVFCRVRPQVGAAAERSLVRIPSGQLEPMALDLVGPGGAEEGGATAAKGAPRKVDTQRFKFDRVFGEGASQAEIFHEVSQLTQSALDGYKVCIFAYGQTGSGKTFTMEGLRGDYDKRGVVPRAAEQMFTTAAELKLIGWTYEFSASFLEIYNDELRDLLPAGAEAKGKASVPAKLDIKHAGGEVHVPNLRSVPVTDAEQLSRLMDAATRVRATSATKMNEHSSRSHYIFRMRLVGKNSKTGAETDGELNLVDLAGSERTKDSGVTGDAMKEANAINLSLTSLGSVISAIAAKSAHVPFRDSKLTHFLQTALSGSSKTLMFVNVSPSEKHHQESLSSLRFAAKVNNTETGKAEKKGKAAAGGAH